MAENSHSTVCVEGHVNKPLSWVIGLNLERDGGWVEGEIGVDRRRFLIVLRFGFKAPQAASHLVGTP